MMILIAVLTGCVAVIGANSLALGPIAPVIGRDLESSIATTMIAAAGYGFGTTIGALFLSRLIDAIGVKKALSGGLAGLIAAFLLSAAAPSIGVLILAQFGAGLAAGIGLPAIYAFTALIAPKGQESTVLGRVLVGWTISMVAGVSLSSVLADLLHWRFVYCILALCAGGALLALRRFAPETAPAPAGPARSALSALGIPGVLPLIGICLAYMTAFYGTYGYLGDHLHAALGLPLSAGGLAALVYGAGFGAAALANPLVDRFGRQRVMPASFLLIAVVYGLLGLADQTFGALLVLCLAWGLANHFGLNLIVAGLSDIRPDRRGSILGLNSAATYLAASTGALAFGPLYETHGFASLAFTAAGLTAGAALLAVYCGRQERTLQGSA